MVDTLFARRFVTTAFVLALMVGVLPPRVARAQTTADLDAFRERLATFLREVEEVHVLTGIHAEGAPGPAEAAFPDLNSLSYEDLAELMKAYPADPRFWNAPRKLLNALKGVRAAAPRMPGVSVPLPRGGNAHAVLARWLDRSSRRSRLSAEDVSVLMNAYSSGRPVRQAPQAVVATLHRAYRIDDDLIGRADVMDLVQRTPPAQSAVAAGNMGVTLTPVAATTADTPDSYTCPAGFDYEALWIARDAELVADIAMEVIPEDAVTSPAYIVAAVAWSALKVTLFAVEQVYERWDDCESAQVFAQVDATISSRATQSSVDALQSGITATQTGMSSVLTEVATIPTTFAAQSAALLQAATAVTQTAVAVESAATRSSVDALTARIDNLAAIGASGDAVNELSAVVNATVPHAIGPSGPIVVYTLPNFDGGSQVLQGNETAALECMSAPFRYGIRSLQVPAGTTVTFYSQCGYQGVSATFTATDSDLTDNKLVLSTYVSVFPAASMRIEQTQVPFPAVIASQAGLDALSAKVDGLDLSAVGALASKMDAVESSVGGLSGAIDAPVSTRATQASVDALATRLATVGDSVGALDLGKLDVGVSTRASQASIDAVQSTVAGVRGDLAARVDGLDAALNTRASQASLDQVASALATRASQGSVDAAAAGIMALLQQRFDDLAARAAQQPLHLQVVEVAKERYLAYVTEGGRPVAGATLIRLQALSSKPRGPLTVADVTAAAVATEVAPGVLEIRVRRGDRLDGVIVSVSDGSGPSARVASVAVQQQRGED